MSISVGIPSSSWLLWTSLWNFKLTLEPSIETWRILLRLRSLILSLKSFFKSWLVQCPINKESQYLTLTCIFSLFQYRISKPIWHVSGVFVERFIERHNEPMGLIQLSGNTVWNKLEASWFELLEIPLKKQCNAHIIYAEFFSKFYKLSSKVCCFDEELSLTFEVDSSTETGGSLAEKGLKKQDILLTTETCFVPFSWLFIGWIPMFESSITLWQSLHLACEFSFLLTSQEANSA